MVLVGALSRLPPYQFASSFFEGCCFTGCGVWLAVTAPLWDPTSSDFFLLFPIPVRLLPTVSRPLPGQDRNVPTVSDSGQKRGAAALVC